MQESSLYDAVQEIDCLDKVVLETLRLYSPAPRYGIVYEIVTINITSSWARSARFATCARSSLRSLSLRSSINIVCCGVVDCCSHTAHRCIHDDKLVTLTKMLVNIILIAMGTVVPMSKVEGSWT